MCFSNSQADAEEASEPSLLKYDQKREHKLCTETVTQNSSFWLCFAHHLFNDLLNVRLPHIVLVRAVGHYEALGLVVFELGPFLDVKERVCEGGEMFWFVDTYELYFILELAKSQRRFVQSYLSIMKETARYLI